MSAAKIGIIGAGVISDQYLKNTTTYPDIEVVAIADKVAEKARSQAEKYGVAVHGTNEVVLDNPDIELVINITTPDAHAEVANQVVEAGKHVWNEKPLTDNLETAKELLANAERHGVRVGCAPDTVIGPGWQAVRRVIERGDIGEPLTGQILFQSPGPEKWHPAPDFLFQAGAGPLLDIGPYYLTAMTQVFGAVSRVSAHGSRAHDTRTIGSGPRAGESFDVTVPTHVGALLEYADGGKAQAVFSFDSAISRTTIEIQGTEGAIVCPDPNVFGGEVVLTRNHEKESTVVASVEADGQGRGIGATDMLRSIRAGEDHRAPGRQALHILDVMLTAQSLANGEQAQLSTSTVKPALLPEGWDPKVATL